MKKRRSIHSSVSASRRTAESRIARAAAAPTPTRSTSCRSAGNAPGAERRYSVTSGTAFHSRKLAIRDYLGVIALFCNGVKGTSALQMSRDMNINPKSAFVLLHKLREAMGATVHDGGELSNAVEVDGMLHAAASYRQREPQGPTTPTCRTLPRTPVKTRRGRRPPARRSGHDDLGCRQGSRWRAADPPARRVGNRSSCRRSGRLEHPPRQLPDEARQS